MEELFELRFEDAGRTARAIRVQRVDELDTALDRLGLARPRPTLVLIGGAAGMTADDLERLCPLFSEAIAPVVGTVQGLVLDGGTDYGVMRLMGEARDTAAVPFPLLGIVPAGLVDLSGAGSPEKTRLEPHHTHFLIVPGEAWGDESGWFEEVAARTSGDLSSLALLINGGPLARREFERRVAAKRPALVVKGSGGVADELAARTERHFDVVDIAGRAATLRRGLERHLGDLQDEQI